MEVKIKSKNNPFPELSFSVMISIYIHQALIHDLMFILSSAAVLLSKVKRCLYSNIKSTQCFHSQFF